MCAVTNLGQQYHHGRLISTNSFDLLPFVSLPKSSFSHSFPHTRLCPNFKLSPKKKAIHQIFSNLCPVFPAPRQEHFQQLNRSLFFGYINNLLTAPAQCTLPPCLPPAPRPPPHSFPPITATNASFYLSWLIHSTIPQLSCALTTKAQISDVTFLLPR